MAQYTYVIIGGGVSSVCAVMGIREHDSSGSIAIIRDEDTVPYDRPPLSKGFLRNDEMSLDDVSSKFDSFYPENKVDLITGVSATQLKPDVKQVQLSDGRTIGYDKLLLATGSRAIMPPVTGSDLPHVCLLRTLADAEAIRQKLKSASSVVFVGAGYIAIEGAGTALKMGKQVSIVAPDPYPWSGFAGETVGNFVESYYRNLGVSWYLGNTVTEITESGVVLDDGTDVPADLVIMGTGVLPNVELGEFAGLTAGPEGIHANETLRTSDPSIFTCGDVAYLFDERLGHSWRGEHHLHAKWTGQVAGENMTGAEKAYARVPYFWSDFHEHHMILRGYCDVGDNIQVFGDADSGNVTELVFDSHGVLRMGLAISSDEPQLDPISDTLEAWISEGATLQSIDPAQVTPKVP